MRKLILISILSGGLGLAGCSDDGGTIGGGDASLLDVGGDTSGGDAGTDTGGEDATEDAGGEDATEDAGGEDATEDAGGEDATEDAGGEDAGEDAGGEDAGGEDAGEDAGGEDAGEDVVEDAGPTCGDGETAGDEECDDGNTDDGDGCSADCTIEPTFTLTATVTLNDYPVGAVPVTIWSVTDGEDGEVLTEVGTGTSDAVTGAVELAELMPGTYRATAELWEYIFVPGEVEITDADAGATIELISSSYPTEADAFGESSFEEPIEYAVGNALWPMTIFPDGDQDYFAIELTGGTTYEIFSTNLNEAGDTYIEQILDAEGETGDESDDFLDYDSNVRFTPEEDGTYIFRVRQYADPCEKTSYLFTVIELEDPDDDDFGAYHDCNNDDGDVYPDATEVLGNDVDEDCDGYMAPDGLTETMISDTDDTRETAIAIEASIDVSYEEVIYNTPLMTTVNGVGDSDAEDWYVLDMPPHSLFSYNGLPLGDASNGRVTFYIGDETSATNTFPSTTDERYLENDTDEPTQAFFRFRGSEIEEGDSLYAFQIVSLGFDNDEDGLYSRHLYYETTDLNDDNPEIGACGD